jgi:hypothetical protein
VTEQARRARDQEQAEAWAEAAVAGAGEVADKGEEAALRQARVDIAFAPPAVKGRPIN